MLNLKRLSLLRAQFARREDGAIAIETMIMLPLMFWAYLALFSTFDAYRQYSMHQKAAYTISDMISRETVSIDDNYMDGALALFDALTRDPQESTLRVSVVSYNENEEAGGGMSLLWSQTRGGFTSAQVSAVPDWQAELPSMIHNEQIIVVETWAKYDPPFRTGIGEREISNFIFTRPRYAPQVKYNDGTGDVNS